MARKKTLTLEQIDQHISALRAEVQRTQAVETVKEEITTMAQRLEQLQRLVTGISNTPASEPPPGTENGTTAKPRRVARGSSRPRDVPELVELVASLLRQRPRTYRELIELTGEPGNRVGHALTVLKRSDTGLVNLGNGYRAVWSLPGGKGGASTSAKGGAA